MGLNDIKLSPSVVTALYKSVLVQDPATGQMLRIETIEERVSEEDPGPPPPPGKKAKKDEAVTAAKNEDQIIEISHITITTEEEDPIDLPPGKKPKVLSTQKTVVKSLGGNQKN